MAHHFDIAAFETRMVERIKNRAVGQQPTIPTITPESKRRTMDALRQTRKNPKLNIGGVRSG